MKPMNFGEEAFLICTLVGLIFGLTGCYSGKLPDNPDSSDQVEVRNSNISYNQLKDIKTIDITSSIFLDFRNSEASKNYSQVKSKCWNNYLEEFFNLARIDNTESLPVKDILPVQAFTPSSNLKPELFCDFEISILNDNDENTNNSKIVLKDISIRNIESYSDFDLPLENGAKVKPLYLQKKDIKDVKFIMPMDKGQVFTLCEESGKVYSFREKVLPMGDFFDEKLFDENNLPFCRLVIHQQNPEKNWVTEAFFIQGQEQKITYQYRHNYTGWTRNRWDGQKMGVLTLSNEGPAVAYLQIPELSTKVSAMAVYSNFSKKNVNHSSSQIIDLNVFWLVDDRTPARKGDEKSPAIYKLESGQSINLSLKTHDGFLCNPGETVKVTIEKNFSIP